MENAIPPLEDDADVLRYLLEVESDAASLAIEASEEADKRRNAAKQKADSEYHSRYDELISSLDAWLAAEKEKCDAELKAIFSDYEERLKALPRDVNSFYSFVGSALTGN